MIVANPIPDRAWKHNIIAGVKPAATGGLSALRQCPATDGAETISRRQAKAATPQAAKQRALKNFAIHVQYLSRTEYTQKHWNFLRLNGDPGSFPGLQRISSKTNRAYGTQKLCQTRQYDHRMFLRAEADALMLPDPLNQIPPDQKTGSATADGAYDPCKCHDAIAARNTHAVIPPRKSAKLWRPVTRGARTRIEAVRPSKLSMAV